MIALGRTANALFLVAVGGVAAAGAWHAGRGRSGPSGEGPAPTAAEAWTGVELALLDAPPEAAAAVRPWRFRGAARLRLRAAAEEGADVLWEPLGAVAVRADRARVPLPPGRYRLGVAVGERAPFWVPVRVEAGAARTVRVRCPPADLPGLHWIGRVTDARPRGLYVSGEVTLGQWLEVVRGLVADEDVAAYAERAALRADLTRTVSRRALADWELAALQAHADEMARFERAVRRWLPADPSVAASDGAGPAPLLRGTAAGGAFGLTIDHDVWIGRPTAAPPWWAPAECCPPGSRSGHAGVPALPALEPLPALALAPDAVAAGLARAGARALDPRARAALPPGWRVRLPSAAELRAAATGDGLLRAVVAAEPGRLPPAARALGGATRPTGVVRLPWDGSAYGVPDLIGGAPAELARGPEGWVYVACGPKGPAGEAAPPGDGRRLDGGFRLVVAPVD